jgi:hypothetical protein
MNQMKRAQMMKLPRSQLPRKAKPILNLMMIQMKIQKKKKSLKLQSEKHPMFQMVKVNKQQKSKLKKNLMKKKKKRKKEMKKKLVEKKQNYLLET